MKNTAKIGSEAPDFELSGLKGEKWQLSQMRGKVVALLFYPGDETIVCTKQLCSLRDNWERYAETGAEIVGISPSDSSKQEKFSTQHRLPLQLLSDADRKITSIYAKSSWLPVSTTRGIVIIDAKGFVRYRNVMLRAFRPTDDEVLNAIHLAKYDALTDRRVSA